MYINTLNRKFVFTFKNNTDLLYKLKLNMKQIITILLSYTEIFHKMAPSHFRTLFYNIPGISYDILDKLLKDTSEYIFVDINNDFIFTQYILYCIDGIYSVEKSEFGENVEYILYKHSDSIFEIKHDVTLDYNDILSTNFLFESRHRFFKYINGNIHLYAFKYELLNRVLFIYSDTKFSNNLSINIVSPTDFLQSLTSLDKPRFNLNITAFANLFNMNYKEIYKCLELYYLDYCIECGSISMINKLAWRRYDYIKPPTTCTNCNKKGVYTVIYDKLNNELSFNEEVHVTLDKIKELKNKYLNNELATKMWKYVTTETYNTGE